MKYAAIGENGNLRTNGTQAEFKNAWLRHGQYFLFSLKKKRKQPKTKINLNMRQSPTDK